MQLLPYLQRKLKQYFTLVNINDICNIRSLENAVNTVLLLFNSTKSHIYMAVRLVIFINIVIAEHVLFNNINAFYE